MTQATEIDRIKVYDYGTVWGISIRDDVIVAVRKPPDDATDSPLTGHEEIINAFCEEKAGKR